MRVSAYRSEDIATAALAEDTKGISQGGAKSVSVEIADAARLESGHAPWAALLPRADALNVFMDPALVRVASEIDPSAEHRALLAWKSVDGRRQLVGIWSFGIGYARKSVLPFRILTIPAYVHSYLATPVVDRDCLDDTLHAMLDRIADDPQLPKIIALDAIGTDGPTYEALRRVLAHRGS